jgi:hypothetical protein
MNKFGLASSVSQKGASLFQVLNNVPSLNLPAWWLIGTLVLIYVLLVGPINYVVLRAINRRALAWITVPVISIVASGVAYGSSVLTKGTSVQASEIAIVHAEQGWNHAYQETYTGIVTPTRGDYDVVITGARILISSLPNYSNGYPNSNQSLIRVDPSNNDVTLPSMTAFTLRGFATEGITTAPLLVAQAQMSGGNLTGTIQNRSTVRFTDGVVFAGGAFQKFGPLAPGASVSFSLQPAAPANPYGGGPPAYMQAYQSSFYGPRPPGPMTDEQRDNQTKMSVIQTLPVTGFKGADRASIPTVIAWTKQPFEDLTVNGSHPRAYAQTGVVLTVPVNQIGAGTLPAGVVNGRVIDMEGEAQQGGGPPGMVIQKGSVTYAFTPALGPGLHLAKAAFVSPSMPMKGGYAGSTGAASPLKVQLWDWSRSGWVDTQYSETPGSTTSVPDSAVNPTTGEVRLQLSSDNFFSAGGFSLTGEVA